MITIIAIVVLLLLCARVAYSVVEAHCSFVRQLVDGK